MSSVDSDPHLCKYFAALPGPTYALARYTDWIRPYLKEQLEDARKGYNGSHSAQKEETIAKCLSMLDIYEKYLSVIDYVSQVEAS